MFCLNNEVVAKESGKSRANRIGLLYPCYTLTILFCLLAFMGMSTQQAWGGGNTWTADVGVGQGVGTVYAEIYSDATWPANGVKNTSNKTTTSTTKQATWTSTSSSTKGHAIFHATAGTGYSFAAWYTNSACTKGKVTSNPYSTTSNTGGTYTYYAKFTPKTYTVTLDMQSGTGGSASVEATYNSSNNLTSSITCPTRTGYTFGGTPLHNLLSSVHTEIISVFLQLPFQALNR